MKETIKVLLSEEEVDKRISEIGQQITEEYAGKEIVLVGILKGSVFFMCELAKRINLPVSIDFMTVSSYGSGTVSSGNVKIKRDLDTDIIGKHIIIVEDIIDSGNTLAFLRDVLLARQPESLSFCTLLDKPDRRVTQVFVDYIGFQIPDKFVVGYGLDYDQKYRTLPYIGIVEFEED